MAAHGYRRVDSPVEQPLDHRAGRARGDLYPDKAVDGGVDLQKDPGRYVIKPVEGIENWPYYWHAFIGNERINGGLAQDHLQAVQEAKRSIALWRKRDFLANFFFDVETQKWWRKGEIPTL
jgi:hypothetical protein